MSVDNARTEPVADSLDRVCPECGQTPGDHVFCQSCGLNLSAVSRLPTRAEREQASALRANEAAHQIAGRLQAIAPATPLRPASGPPDVAVLGAVKNAVASALAAKHKGYPVSVDMNSVSGAVVRVGLTDGAEVEQRFSVAALGTGRLKIMPQGPSVLVSGAVRQEIPVSAPVAVAETVPGLSSADARELAARRARDKELLARVTGWKPLPIWYAFWGCLIAFGSVSALLSGQVLGALVGLAICCACFKYVHYLYHGGLRRVWFVIW